MTDDVTATTGSQPVSNADSSLDPAPLAGPAPAMRAESAGALTAGDMNLRMGGVGALRADRVQVQLGGVGAAQATQVDVQLGGVGAVLAREAHVQIGTAGSIAARDAYVEQGLVRTLVAQRVTINRPTGVLVMIAQHVSGDVRPMIDWRGALAAGAAIGLGLVLSRIRRDWAKRG